MNRVMFVLLSLVVFSMGFCTKTSAEESSPNKGVFDLIPLELAEEELSRWDRPGMDTSIGGGIRFGLFPGSEDAEIGDVFASLRFSLLFEGLYRFPRVAGAGFQTFMDFFSIKYETDSILLFDVDGRVFVDFRRGVFSLRAHAGYNMAILMAYDLYGSHLFEFGGGVVIGPVYLEYSVLLGKEPQLREGVRALFLGPHHRVGIGYKASIM